MKSENSLLTELSACECFQEGTGMFTKSFKIRHRGYNDSGPALGIIAEAGTVELAWENAEQLLIERFKLNNEETK